MPPDSLRLVRRRRPIQICSLRFCSIEPAAFRRPLNQNVPASRKRPRRPGSLASRLSVVSLQPWRSVPVVESVRKQRLRISPPVRRCLAGCKRVCRSTVANRSCPPRSNPRPMLSPAVRDSPPRLLLSRPHKSRPRVIPPAPADGTTVEVLPLPT